MTDALPVSLIGMNEKLMCQYIRFVAGKFCKVVSRRVTAGSLLFVDRSRRPIACRSWKRKGVQRHQPLRLYGDDFSPGQGQLLRVSCISILEKFGQPEYRCRPLGSQEGIHHGRRLLEHSPYYFCSARRSRSLLRLAIPYSATH